MLANNPSQMTRSLANDMMAFYRLVALAIALCSFQCARPKRVNEIPVQLDHEAAIGRSEKDSPITSRKVITPDYWLGMWEDGTGYWVIIRKEDQGYKLERSGSGNEVMNFKKKSSDGKSFVYEEVGYLVHYQHTLTKKSGGVISDEWYDLRQKKVWAMSSLQRQQSKRN